MIINNNLQGIASIYNNNNNVNKTKQNSYAQAAAEDEIQISTKGQQFNDLLQKLKAGSEVRQEKVVQYENMIASGNYYVSSQDLADRIIQTRY